MNDAKKDKKRIHPGVKVLIILLAVIAVLGLTVAALGLNLLNRISRPAERILRADAAHGGAACPVRCG